MPILDSIQAAEKKAEHLRSEAADKVKKLLEDTKIQSEETAKQMIHDAYQEEKRVDQETLNQIALKEKEIKSVYEKQDQDLVLQANKNMDLAIDFIIKKVFEI